jgi:SAM-dependent methyltransferase
MSSVRTPEPSTRERAWYVTAFDRLWLRLHPQRDDAEAARHAPAILAMLGLKAGASLLDVGCGAGRYARAFAARGLRVTGVDLSPDMLEEARARSPNLPGMPIYLRWDARTLPFVAQFDGAVSLFTSLGYFAARQDDVAILRGVHRALVPGGVFLLDYLNPAHVRATLVAEEHQDVAGYSVHLRRSLEESAAGPLVVKHVVVRRHGARSVEGEFTERVRLYEPAEIDALLTDAGLVPEGERRGDLDGGPFGPTSERQVRMARKPAGR